MFSTAFYIKTFKQKLVIFNYIFVLKLLSINKKYLKELFIKKNKQKQEIQQINITKKLIIKKTIFETHKLSRGLLTLRFCSELT